MSQMNKTEMNLIKLSIRMGSNRFEITLKNQQNVNLTFGDLIEQVLKQMKLNGSENLSKTYSVYENILGIERKLKRTDLILNNLKKNQNYENRIEFVIRKSSKLEINLRKQIKENKQKRQKIVKKCFKKLNENNNNKSTKDTDHIYESINNTQTEVKIQEQNNQEVYLKKILENEIILQKQTRKLEKLEKKINKKLLLKSQESNEIGLQLNQKSKLIENFMNIKQLASQSYLKLKNKRSSTSLNTSTTSRTFLIRSNDDLNSCGNSSDEYQSRSSSRSCSTTTLESLV